MLITASIRGWMLRRYEAGDVASLRPENPPEDVDCFIRRMGWIEDADKILELSSTDPGE